MALAIKIGRGSVAALLKELFGLLDDEVPIEEAKRKAEARMYEIGCKQVAGLAVAVGKLTAHYRYHHDTVLSTAEVMSYLYDSFRGSGGDFAPQTLALTGAVMAEILSGDRDMAAFVEDVRRELGEFRDMPDYVCSDTAGHKVKVRLEDGSVVEARVAGDGEALTPPKSSPPEDTDAVDPAESGDRAHIHVVQVSER